MNGFGKTKENDHDFQHMNNIWEYTCLIWLKKLNSYQQGDAHIRSIHSELYSKNEDKVHLLLKANDAISRN